MIISAKSLTASADLNDFLFNILLGFNMTTKPCTIKLLNKTFEIKCPEGQEAQLQIAAKKLNDQLSQNKKKFGQLDDFHLLLLSALNLSYDLLNCQQEQEQHRQQVAQLISSLEHKIHQVVAG